MTIGTVDLRDPGGDFTLDASACANQALLPGATCLLKVSFAPTVPGPRAAAIVILDDTSEHQQVISLSGIGSAPVKTLDVLPAAVNFAARALNTTSDPQTITLRASGDTPMAINTINLLGDSGDFTLDAGACANQTLSPGASCILKVAFAPTASGPRAAIVLILDDTAAHQHRVSLAGTGKKSPHPAA